MTAGEGGGGAGGVVAPGVGIAEAENGFHGRGSSFLDSVFSAWWAGLGRG
jgi:hypothetical protein